MKYVITIIILMISCNNNLIQIHFDQAKDFIESGELGKGIKELRFIIDKFPNNNKSAEAQFQIGEIYLNDVKDYLIAIDEFKKVILLFPNSNHTPKAMFMIGYIYANYLDAYSDAIEYYNNFTIEFPKHDLYPSVLYELDQLSKYIEIIDSLKQSIL